MFQIFFLKIDIYLVTLRQFLQINTKKLNTFKKKPIKFKVKNHHIFCPKFKNV